MRRRFNAAGARHYSSFQEHNTVHVGWTASQVYKTKAVRKLRLKGPVYFIDGFFEK